MLLCMFVCMHINPAALRILCTVRRIIAEPFHRQRFTKYLQCHDDGDILKKAIYVKKQDFSFLGKKSQERIVEFYRNTRKK